MAHSEPRNLHTAATLCAEEEFLGDDDLGRLMCVTRLVTECLEAWQLNFGVPLVKWNVLKLSGGQDERRPTNC